jgi:hypothetical protein
MSRADLASLAGWPDEHAYVNDHQRSLTSFEIARSAREDQAAASQRACPRASVNEREVYKPS